MLMRRGRRTAALPLRISYETGGFSFKGSTRDVSSKGLCMEVPSPRIKTCMFDLLHKNVTIEIENEVLDGNIRWYTLEGSTYRIGIRVEKHHKSNWKRILEDRRRPPKLRKAPCEA